MNINIYQPVDSSQCRSHNCNNLFYFSINMKCVYTARYYKIDTPFDIKFHKRGLKDKKKSHNVHSYIFFMFLGEISSFMTHTETK